MHCLSTLRRRLTVLTALHFGKNYYLKISVETGKMLKAIYSDVKACVRSTEGLSDMICCPVCVKQGCIICPILFSLFLNDLQESISIGSHGIDLDTMKIFVLLFADDLVLFAETVIELQRMINRLAEYCDLWHIKVHVLKTKVIKLYLKMGAAT